MVEHSPGERVDGRGEALPVAPGLGAELQEAGVPPRAGVIDRRVLVVCALAVVIAAGAALIARALTALIGLVTNLAYFGRVSTDFVSPAGSTFSPLVLVAIPVIGGLVVGLMARFGSRGIRGHGIPEAMEQVLHNQSRIPPRLTFLKPLSAAVAIGTGGPFGAEGPIISTGGSLGSLLGQLLHTTAAERKTLLAAGAAAGMAATFGSPVSAVLLAIELLLFEYRARSIIPVALAAVTATGVRTALVGGAPVFPMPAVPMPGLEALGVYVLVGAVAGLAAVLVTRLVYGIEDAFERLPIHWMWWPALGAVVVGLVGLLAPLTLGVGYDNIEHIISGELAGRAMLVLVVLKLVSWSVALGSGTSGGTLAPLLTIGGGVGSALGVAATRFAPGLGVDPRMAALVGMAALFAGASRAMLASVVFAFETTQQPVNLLPLLGGCAAAWLVSLLFMRHSIMTEKISRKGVPVPSEYSSDVLEQLRVGAVASRTVVTLRAGDALAEVRAWLVSGAADAHHEGFPVLDDEGVPRGVVTRRDLLDGREPDGRRVRDLVRRAPVVIDEDRTLRDAADRMIRAHVGRLVVVASDDPRRMTGILTRGDLLAAHVHRHRETNEPARGLRLRMALRPIVRHDPGPSGGPAR